MMPDNYKVESLQWLLAEETILTNTIMEQTRRTEEAGRILGEAKSDLAQCRKQIVERIKLREQSMKLEGERT